MKRNIFITAFFIVLISIPIITEANDSLTIESENPIIYNKEVKLPWYKNMNYTFGYGIGLRLYLSVVDMPVFIPYWLNSIEAGVMIPINNRKIYMGLKYGRGNIGNYQNSIETGLMIPINNRKIYMGLGYRWGNIYQVNYQTILFDTINSSFVQTVLNYKNIKKLYIYTGYSISKSIHTGLELNYCQGYGDEEYCYGSSNVFEISSVRRDLIGGGGCIKLSPKITLNENFRINPYLMFEISGSYEVHSTSPYSGLWDKKLTVWYMGIDGGFNLNIGGDGV